MPHLPRSLPPSTGVQPELDRAKPAAPPPPPSTVNAGTGAKPARLSMAIPKISPHTYTPDQDRIIEQLLGKENVTVDQDTGAVTARLP